MKAFSILSCLASLVFLVTAAQATTGGAVAPWLPLAGGYDSSVNDGRLLGFPPAPLLTGFFDLTENSILSMTADSGGWSRSAAACPCCGVSIFGLIGCLATQPVPFELGEVWENSNGGRGFTSKFCGGYQATGCTVPASVAVNEDFTMGHLLGGPPSAMDAVGRNASPNDVASAGWPAALLTQMNALRTEVPDMCVAPEGLIDERANDCGPGLTWRTGQSSLFVSPDAGRQWYPVTSSCGFAWNTGAELIAVDAGMPGHVVTYNTGNASGCPGGNPYRVCAERRIAWTGDASRQIAASIKATKPGEQSSIYDVDAAGAPSGNAVDGWRYAALGHLALGSTPGGTCDVAHAGIQLGCHAAPEKLFMCHANYLSPDEVVPHDALCPAQDELACSCGFQAGAAVVHVDDSTCLWPAATSLAIDPRSGQVYAPSNVGLLWSPDGGRKWRRHGHSGYSKWSAAGSSSATSSEPYPYENPPAMNATGDPGVRLLTLQGMPAQAVDDASALDLNGQPEQITKISRVTFATTPCAGTLLPYVDPMGFWRYRVHVTAAVSVSWKNPVRPAQAISGVFVAHGDSCTDENAVKPLVFRDTANLMPGPAAGGLLDKTAVWSADDVPKTLSGAGVVKLPRAQTVRTQNSALVGSAGQGPSFCRMNYISASVSPSDPRVLHAWAYPHGGADFCPGLSGLWRSLDGGANWHLAAGPQDPQVRGSFAFTSSVELTTSAADPYHVMVTTRGDGLPDANKESMDFRPTAAIVPSVPACPMTGCDWQFTAADRCAGVVASALSCTTHSDGLFDCGTSASRAGCTVAPNWALAGIPPENSALQTTIAAADVLQASLPCVDCVSNAPSIGPGSPASNCCLQQRLFANASQVLQGQQIVNFQASTTELHSYGNSGGSVQCLQDLGTRWFVGEDDATSHLTDAVATNSFMSKGNSHYALLKNIETDRAIVAISVAENLKYLLEMENPFAAPNDVWMISNRGDPGAFSRLIWAHLPNTGSGTLATCQTAVDCNDADACTVDSCEAGVCKHVISGVLNCSSLFTFPNIVSNQVAGQGAVQEPGKPTEIVDRIPSRWSGGLFAAGDGHFRLLKGPWLPTHNPFLRWYLPDLRSSLVALIPGIGVYLMGADEVFRAAIHDLPNDNPAVSLATTGFAARIPFENGDTANACVADAAFVSPNLLFVVVASAHPTDWTWVRCAVPPDGPGLYVSSLDEAFFTLGSTAGVGGAKLRKVGLNAPISFLDAPVPPVPPLNNPIAIVPWSTFHAADGSGLLLGNFPDIHTDVVTETAGVWGVSIPANFNVESPTATSRRVAAIGTVHDISVSIDGHTAVVAATNEGSVESRLGGSSPWSAFHPANSAEGAQGEVDNQLGVGKHLLQIGNQRHGIYELLLPPPLQLAFVSDSCAPGAANCTLLSGGVEQMQVTGAANGGFRWTQISQSAFGDVVAGTKDGEGAFWLPRSARTLKGDSAESPPGNFPPPVPPGGLDHDLTWRAEFAGMYVAGSSPTPLGRGTALPTWLASQLDLDQPGHRTQRVERIPAAAYRSGFDALAGLPLNVKVSVAADRSASNLHSLGTTPEGRFEFSVSAADLTDIAPLGRLHVSLTGAFPAGAHFELNGQPIAVANAVVGVRSSVTLMTGGIRAGTNSLNLICAPNNCAVSIRAVKGAAGAFKEVALTGTAAGNHATGGFDWPGPANRRRSIWAVVALKEVARPTLMRFNGSNWQRVVGDNIAGINANLVRVLVDPAQLVHGPNLLEFAATDCASSTCGGLANVLSAGLLVEYSEDPEVRMVAPEICGDNLDNDCNGKTDGNDFGTTLCDSIDADGCRLGRASCDQSLCDSDLTVPPLSNPPAEVTLPAESMDFVLRLVDGSPLRLPVPQSMQIPLFATFRHGVDLGFMGMLLPSEPPPGAVVTGIEFHLSDDAVGHWAVGNVDRPVSIRDRDDDDGRTFALEFVHDVAIDPHKSLLLMVAQSNFANLESVYGCPGGELTYPAHLSVVSLCDLESVNCAPGHEGGSWCDGEPMTSVCASCTGDWDGCTDGVRTDSTGQCLADSNPNGSGESNPTSITMYVESITWYFAEGTYVEVLPTVWTLNLLALANGQVQPLEALTVPALGTNSPVTRLDLEGGVTASLPGVNGPVPVLLKNGPNQSGDRLTLSVVSGTGPHAGEQVHMMAEANNPEFRRVYTCTDASQTMTSWMGMTVPVSPPPPPPPSDPGACVDIAYATVFAVQVSSIVFCYDDQTCRELSPPSPINLDVLALLQGNPVFGGMTWPLPPLGSSSSTITSMRLRGSFLGTAFDTGIHGFMPVPQPSVEATGPTLPPNDGLLLTFEPDYRPTVGDVIALRISPQSVVDTRIFKCPNQARQFSSTLNVRTP